MNKKNLVASLVLGVFLSVLAGLFCSPANAAGEVKKETKRFTVGQMMQVEKGLNFRYISPEPQQKKVRKMKRGKPVKCRKRFANTKSKCVLKVKTTKPIVAGKGLGSPVQGIVNGMHQAKEGVTTATSDRSGSSEEVLRAADFVSDWVDFYVPQTSYNTRELVSLARYFPETGYATTLWGYGNEWCLRVQATWLNGADGEGVWYDSEKNLDTGFMKPVTGFCANVNEDESRAVVSASSVPGGERELGTVGLGAVVDID